MYNFPLIARSAAVPREAAPVTTKYLYDENNVVVDQFNSTWLPGASVVYTIDSAPFLTNGDYHSGDDIFRIQGGIIIKKGQNLFDSSYGFSILLYEDCALTSQTRQFYSNTYFKWKYDRWNEDANWLHGDFLQNSDTVTYTNGENTGSVRFCPYEQTAYYNCYAASIMTGANYPVYSWVNPTAWMVSDYVYLDPSYATPATSTFYANIGGGPKQITLNVNGQIQTINTCSAGYSFACYETPYKAINSGGYPLLQTIYSPDSILQVASVLYSDEPMTSTLAAGYYYTTSHVIVTDFSGVITTLNPAFSVNTGYEECSMTTASTVYAYAMLEGNVLYANVDYANPGAWITTGPTSWSNGANYYVLDNTGKAIISISPCAT